MDNFHNSAFKIFLAVGFLGIAILLFGGMLGKSSNGLGLLEPASGGRLGHYAPIYEPSSDNEIGYMLPISY